MRRLAAACSLLVLVLAPAFAAETAASRDAVLVNSLPVRDIGPANMGGRIVDVAVVESKPEVMYVAAATGGLWKTMDGGETWKPVFEGQPTLSLGDVTVAPSNPDIVWVGTGEANARNSVSWGDGVYRSTDAGKTWKNMGLKETQHIGRIVIHPRNPDVVYVAALGHLWGANKERGLFKTTDGGKTWEKSLYFDEDTGCIDVALDPDEPDTLYAALYCVRRDGFSGGNPATQFGKNAGLYKTTDAGKTWEKLTKGLPETLYGRCGLDIYRRDPRVVYAVIQTDKTPATTPAGPPARAGDKVETGGIFRSEDRGKSWKKVNDLCPRPFYFGQVRIDPNDDKRVYVLGIQFFVTNDGGRTFTAARTNVHPDHHALWINPKDSDHLVLGNDGGLYFSKNRGRNWDAIRRMPLGQFYSVAADTRTPYRVYGGLQDNGSWGGPSATDREDGITLGDWYRVASADGFYCQVDQTDPNTVYAEGQYGMLWRVTLSKTGGIGSTKSIKPAPTEKGRVYRFNWSAPILLSPHDQKTVYYGGNLLFKSVDQGAKWEAISPDLTAGKENEQGAGHTITTIAESPLKAGLIYVGTDDGKLQRTKDGGKSWTDLSAKVPGVPADRWITRVECSHFDEGTAYLTIDRHRNGDRRPYVFRTTDFGEKWEPLSNNLPVEGPVHVIRESSKNRDLLVLGTELGLLVSLDGGKDWQKVTNGLPNVPVHDLLIHPRDRELVIATHGRSMYVMDVWPLEQMTAKVRESTAHLFEVRPAIAFTPRKEESGPSQKGYKGTNPPYGATVFYYLKSPLEAAPRITIADATGKVIAELKGRPEAGLHHLTWNLRAGGGTELVAAGEYTVTLNAGDRPTRKVKVEAAPK